MACGILNPGGRTQEPKLFASEIHEEDAALQLATPRTEQAGEFEDAGSAAGVIVGARMDLADLRGGEGIEVAAAEMIIMRADDDVFVGLARQPCEHIVDRGARGFDVDVKGQVKGVGERERW